MLKTRDRLRPGEVAKLLAAGGHRKVPDGGSLYLWMRGDTAASWLYCFKVGDKVKSRGLGPAATVSLAQARQARNAIELERKSGVAIPMAHQRARRPVGALFSEAAETYIAAQEGAWGGHQGSHWRQTLRDYAKPIAGKPVGAITTADVLACLRTKTQDRQGNQGPIWDVKRDTARCVRHRIEVIWNAENARLDWRRSDNPARWRGHLDTQLAKKRPTKVQHHPAMPWADVPAFLIELRQVDSYAARGLEFLILAGVRTNDVLGATWAEISSDGTLWTIAAGRMKSDRDHRVPLTRRMVELLGERRAPDVFLFPGGKDRGKSGKTKYSHGALVFAMNEALSGTPYHVHGFRSSIRDWCSDVLKGRFPTEVYEMVLAHAVGDETEQAYARSDLLDQRREVMEEWTAFCTG